MPVIPRPEELRSEVDWLRDVLADPEAAKFHKSIEMRLAQPLVIERKTVPSKYFTKPGSGNNRIMMWMKADGKLPDTPSVHQCVAAYCSDVAYM
jgi:acyl-CoA thioesterase-2